MNRELLMLVDAISREKSVDREVVFGAVEAALTLVGLGSPWLIRISPAEPCHACE